MILPAQHMEDGAIDFVVGGRASGFQALPDLDASFNVAASQSLPQSTARDALTLK